MLVTLPQGPPGSSKYLAKTAKTSVRKDFKTSFSRAASYRYDVALDCSADTRSSGFVLAR